MREKLFKFLFPVKHLQIEELQKQRNRDIERMLLSDAEIRILKREAKKPEPTMEDLMRASLGLPMLNFDDIDEQGRPPHFLKDLPQDARKNFIGHMESIYTDEVFQTVVSYVINLLGNHSIQKADEDKMRNGRIAIIGVRTLMNEFQEAHSEFLDSKKKQEEFDPLEIIPE